MFYFCCTLKIKEVIALKSRPGFLGPPCIGHCQYSYPQVTTNFVTHVCMLIFKTRCKLYPKYRSFCHRPTNVYYSPITKMQSARFTEKSPLFVILSCRCPAWPSNDFRVIKNVRTENLPLRKITRVPSNINKASDSAITVNVHWVYPGLHQLPVIAFRSRFRDELTWRPLPFFYSSKTLLFWLFPKMLSKLLFWTYTSLMTSSPVI